jgi:hypothetical protein
LPGLYSHINLLNIYDVKILFIVAPVTGVTELSLVNIVSTMTIDTPPVIVAGLGLFPGVAVTGMAMQLSVCMPELERGFVVIKIPDQPGIGVMA